MWKVIFIFQGKREFSLFSTEWYSCQEAKTEVRELFPGAIIEHTTWVNLSQGAVFK